VSTTQAELVAKLANLPPVSLIIDTGRKFATGVVETGGAP
jgi:hypothetical protein